MRSLVEPRRPARQCCCSVADDNAGIAGERTFASDRTLD
jgi:hypothetical protein